MHHWKHSESHGCHKKSPTRLRKSQKIQFQIKCMQWIHLDLYNNNTENYETDLRLQCCAFRLQGNNDLAHPGMKWHIFPRLKWAWQQMIFTWTSYNVLHIRPEDLPEKCYLSVSGKSLWQPHKIHEFTGVLLILMFAVYSLSFSLLLPLSTSVNRPQNAHCSRVSSLRSLFLVLLRVCPQH